MADDEPIPLPHEAAGGGFPAGPLPDTPGDVTAGAGPWKPGDPFRRLTAAEELKERTRLNLKESFRAGSLGAATLAGQTSEAERKAPTEEAPPQPMDIPGFDPGQVAAYDPYRRISEEDQTKAREDLEKTRFEAASYKTMPWSRSPLQAAGALTGQAIGFALNPETYYTGGVGRLPYLASKFPLISEVSSVALGQGIVQAGTDIGSQAAEIGAGLEHEFSPLRTGFAGVGGMLFGGGFGVAENFGKIKEKMKDYPAAATFAGGVEPKLPPEIKSPVTPSDPTPPPEPRQAEGSGVEISPSPTTTRVFRAEPKGGEKLGDKVVFTADPAKAQAAAGPDGNVTYVDVRKSMASANRHGDEVILPASVAERRKPIPTAEEAPPVPPGKEEPPARTLLQAMRDEGGLQPHDELDAIFGRTKLDIIRTKEKGGMDLDRAVIRARELGYLERREGPPDSKEINKLLDMLADEEAGRAVHVPMGQEARAPQKPDQNFERLRADVVAEMQRLEMDPHARKNRDVVEDATSLLFKGEEKDAERAIERAATRSVKEAERGGHIAKQIPFDLEPAPKVGGPPETGRPGGAALGGDLRGVGEEVAARERGLATPGDIAHPGFDQRQRSSLATPAARAQELAQPVKNLTDIMRRVSDLLNAAVKRASPGRGRTGEFDFRTHIATVQQSTRGGFLTWAHEMGHHLEAVMGKPLTDFAATYLNSMKAVLGPALDPAWSGAKTIREGIASFTEAYITNREYLNAVDPALVQRFQAVMGGSHPELLAALDEANRLLKIYENAPARDVGNSHIRAVASMPRPREVDPLGRFELKIGSLAENLASKLPQSMSHLVPWLPDLPLGKWMDRLYEAVWAPQHYLHLWERLVNEAIAAKYKGQAIVRDLAKDASYTLRAQNFAAGFRYAAESDLAMGVFDYVTGGRGKYNFNKAMRSVTHDPVTGAKPATEALAEARKQEFDTFLAARWHLELRKMVDAGEMVLKGAISPFTDGQARQIVQEVEAAFPHFKDAAEQIYGFQKDLANKQFDYGLITADELAWYMDARNHRYIPMRRDMTDFVAQARVPGATAEMSKLLESAGRFRRTGSERDIISPTDRIGMHTYELSQRAQNNAIVGMMLDHLAILGGPEAAGIAREIPNHVLRKIDIDVEESIIKLATENGWLSADARQLARDVVQTMGAADTRATLWSAENMKAGAKPVVFGWRAGKRVAIEFADGDIGRGVVNVLDALGPYALKQVSTTHKVIVDVLAFPGRALRLGIVSMPTFILARNVTRDATIHPMLLGEVKMPGSTTAIGIKNWWKEHQASAQAGGSWWDAIDSELTGMYYSLGGRKGAEASAHHGPAAFLDVGAKERYGFSGRRMQNMRYETAKRDGEEGVPHGKSLWVTSLSQLEQWAEVTESGPRKGIMQKVYDYDIAQGKSPAYSMWDASNKAIDITDFYRRGSAQIVHDITKIIPFSNATLQGLDKARRVYIGSKTYGGRPFQAAETLTATQLEERARARSAMIWSTVTAATLMSAMEYWNHGDPVIDRMTPEEKASMFKFRIPFTGSGEYETLDGVKTGGVRNGVYVTIPKPFEMGALFNIAQGIIQTIAYRDPEHMRKAAASLYHSFRLPDVIPNLPFGTISELYANKDFYRDTPITSETLANEPPHMRSNAYTRHIYKMVAGFLHDNTPGGSYEYLKTVPILGPALGSFFSPVESQYYVEKWLGSFPKELGGSINTVGGLIKYVASGGDASMLPQVADVPVLNALLRTSHAAGDPLKETFNQVEQHRGALTTAAKEYKSLKEAGDPNADKYLNALSDNARRYAIMKESTANSVGLSLHPEERGIMLNRIVSGVRRQLATDIGMAQMSDPATRIKLEPAARIVVDSALNELNAIEQQNNHIVMKSPGYGHRPIIDTKPELEKIREVAPAVYKELTARFAQGRILPIESIAKHWPDAVKILDAGGADPAELDLGLKSLGNTAAAEGTLGGGSRIGTTTYDIEGERVKKPAAKKSRQIPILPSRGAAP